MDFRGGVNGKLVAVVGDVVSLSVVRYVVPGGSDERGCKGMERNESRWENAAGVGLDELCEICVVCKDL